MTTDAWVARAVSYGSELERKLAETLKESSGSFSEKIAKIIAAWEAEQPPTRSKARKARPRAGE